MTTKLFFSAIFKLFLGVAIIGLLLFLPAGTLRYPNAWIFMGVLFVPMFAAGVVMMLKSPELLKRRLNVREKESEQRLVVKLSGLMFVLGFVISGLSFRYGFAVLPDFVSWIASGVFLLAYALYAEVMRENVYLSRTVEVQEGQRVIDTGLYGIVRHPMYAVTVVLFIAMPFVLGSLIAVPVFLVYPFIIALRIKNEEAVLEGSLEGYAEYKQRVKYRLIPFIW